MYNLPTKSTFFSLLYHDFAQNYTQLRSGMQKSGSAKGSNLHFLSLATHRNRYCFSIRHAVATWGCRQVHHQHKKTKNDHNTRLYTHIQTHTQMYALLRSLRTVLPVERRCSSRSLEIFKVVYSVSAAVPAPQQLQNEKGKNPTKNKTVSLQSK